MVRARARPGGARRSSWRVWFAPMERVSAGALVAVRGGAGRWVAVGATWSSPRGCCGRAGPGATWFSPRGWFGRMLWGLVAAELRLVLWHRRGGGWGCAGADEVGRVWQRASGRGRAVRRWLFGCGGDGVGPRGGYCSGGASREASSCGGKGLCLFASVRSVIEYTPLKVRRESQNAI